MSAKTSVWLAFLCALGCLIQDADLRSIQQKASQCGYQVNFPSRKYDLLWYNLQHVDCYSA